MGFSGRCEAMRAPTTANDTVQVAKVNIPSETKISPRVRPLRRARIKFAAASATHSAHSDQASHAATRALILPSPRSCSLAPSVTAPLYKITVSRSLRKALREEGLETFLLTMRAPLAQGVHSLLYRNFDGHQSSRCVASRFSHIAV